MSGTQNDADKGPGEAGETDPEPVAGTQASVLGNLPKTRPSVRSPRRTKVAPPKPDPRAAAASGQGAETSAESGGEPKRGESHQSSTAELEALARSGVAIAGEAASLGLRIAGRAAAAVRDAVERR